MNSYMVKSTCALFEEANKARIVGTSEACSASTAEANVSNYGKSTRCRAPFQLSEPWIIYAWPRSRLSVPPGLSYPVQASHRSSTVWLTSPVPQRLKILPDIASASASHSCVSQPCMYPDRYRIKCRRNLRFRPKFWERLGFGSDGKTYAPCFQEKIINHIDTLN